MPATREAAGRLVERKLVEVTQKGAVVILTEAKGPIRLRLTAVGQACPQVKAAVPAGKYAEQPRKRGRKQR